MNLIFKNIFMFIYTIFILLIGGFFLVAFTPVIAIVRAFDWSGASAHGISRIYFVILTALIGVKVNVEGKENLDKKTSYLIISNHKSSMDIFILSCKLPLHFKFLAAKYLFSIPFLGWIMSMDGYIPVNRAQKREAYQSVLRGIEVLKNGRAGLLIFPEGTRTELPEIQSLKSGFIRIARETKQPILPVILDGTSDIKKKNEFWYRPAHVNMKILPAIPTADLNEEEWDGLKDTIENEMRAEYMALHEKRLSELNETNFYYV